MEIEIRTVEDAIDWLLIQSRSDWISSSELCSAAIELSQFQTQWDRYEAVREILTALCGRGLAEVGGVSEGVFVKWGGSLEEAIVRVNREWHELGRDPYPDEICWIQATPAGSVLAEDAEVRYPNPPDWLDS